MKALLNLAILALLGVAGYWYFTECRRHEDVQLAEKEFTQSAERLKDAIHGRLKDFSLRSDDIKEELSRTGKVIRQLARDLGATVAEVTADARVTSAIKAKLVADADLSALSISVSTTHGVVTLSGTVATYDEIGKAMLLALETDGVREVISTLQLRQAK